MKPKPADLAGPAVPGASGPLPETPAPVAVDERIERIEKLWQRSDGYVQFICKAGRLGGTSGELKERALNALSAQLVIIERQLSRIHDDLQLG